MYIKQLFHHTLVCLQLSLVVTAHVQDENHADNVKQVAIIGAGAAGSSAAYHLRRYAEAEGLGINITVFEKTGRIGGRTLTVNVYDNPLEPVELGASIFVDVNHILYGAARDFSLSLKDPGTDEKGVLGIWDGDSFVYSQSSESWGWWNLVKLLWKYGAAPYYTRKLVQETVATFLKLYEAPYFPFRSLTSTAFDLGLVKATGVTGLQFLQQHDLDTPFAHDIVQASTRVNYASNLPYIHGLGTMVAMAPEGAVAVVGGNWQIFAHMVKSSRAHVCLNHSVSSIAVEPGNDPRSGAQKYRLKSKTTAAIGSTEAPKEEEHPTAFDSVILASPYQFSGIEHSPNLIQHPVDEIPYVQLHVTLFASPFRFSPAFFKMPSASEVPISVLTTLNPGDEPRQGAGAVGKAGFFSATLQRVVVNPRTTNVEYVYKIFSPHEVTAEFLSSLLGVQVPESIVSSRPSHDADKGTTTVVEPISWFHAAVFHPYPQKLPRVTFQDPILRDGLYYTSGIESFISTMETSALMGKNVARLIVDDYLAGSIPTPDHEDEGQSVLAEQLDKTVEGYGQPVTNPGEL